MNWPALLAALCSMSGLACGGSAPSAPSAVMGSEVALSPGETVRVGALRITFTGVTSDSRCAVDVVCVWEGDAVSRLTLIEPALGAETRELHTSHPRAVTYGRFQVELVRLEPEPRSTRTIPPESYRLVVRVTSAS